MTKKDEIAALRAEVDALKAAQPKPIDWAEQDRAAAKFVDEMRELSERRMSQAMPPSVVRDFAVLDDATVKGIALRDARAPTGPSSQGAIPSSQQVSNVRGAGGGRGSGWSEPSPLSNPPGVNWADRLMDAQDARDRAELVEREAKFKAMQKLAEGKP